MSQYYLISCLSVFFVCLYNVKMAEQRESLWLFELEKFFPQINLVFYFKNAPASAENPRTCFFETKEKMLT